MTRIEQPDTQSELVLIRRPKQTAVPREMVWAKKSAGQAIRLAMDASMLEDKEVYMALRIDPGTWSRILHDKASLPTSQIAEFCDVVNNRVYVEWINYQVGCVPVLIESEAEKAMRKAVERAEAAEESLRIVISGLRGK